MPDEEQDALDALEKEASDFTKVCTEIPWCYSARNQN